MLARMTGGSGLQSPGFRGPVPDAVCQILNNPITQGAITWEQSSQCFVIPFTNTRVCPNDYGVQAADLGTFLSVGCGVGQPVQQMPVVYGQPLEWWQKWQTWAIAGGVLVGVVGIALLAGGSPKSAAAAPA